MLPASQILKCLNSEVNQEIGKYVDMVIYIG